ncbi:MAG TPA: hypothetical protein V6D50_07965 [Chroococcales cyanobacterium]|jgi:hypothetical protein
MCRVSLITLLGMLTLFMGSCTIGEDNTEQGSQSTPSPTPVASPITPKSSPAATPFGNKPPLVAKQAPTSNAAVAGLIPSLPAGVRVQQIPKGRNDPFAAIQVQPEVTVSPNPQAASEPTTRPVPVIPQLPQPPSSRGTATTRSATPRTRGNALPSPRTVAKARAGNTARPKGSVASRVGTNSRGGTSPAQAKPGSILPVPGGAIATAPRLIPQLPQLPEPTLAKSIEVTGVVEVGGQPNAIVKVPNEPSRYVRVGQRLSNGQVLVKRIEMNQGPNPVVILEQYGVEVARRVGEPAEGGPLGSPTASLPPPPPVNNNTAL